jgi:hypothetical protein
MEGFFTKPALPRRRANALSIKRHVQSLTRCEGAGLFEIDGEPEHHATVHVDDDGQRWPLDRLAVLFIDHVDVHGAYGRSGRRLADSQRPGTGEAMSRSPQ